MKLAVVLAGLTGIYLLACSSAAPAPPEPTPNIDATVEAKVAQERAVDATVEARVKEEQAAQPTPTPTATNTPAPTTTPTPTPKPTPTRAPRPTATPTARGYWFKGKEYLQAENWVMAISEFTRAIQVNPNYADAYWDRGYSYSSLDQDQNAISDYTKAIQLNPWVYQPYINRGASYEKLGQYQLAINDYTKAIQLDPPYSAEDDANAYYGRGYAYNALGQHQNAINDYTKAIQLDPGSATAYNNRGYSYLELGGQSTLADADQAKACSLDSQYCRPTSTPVVIDDYGDNRFTAASAYLTVANSPLRFTGEIGTPGDIDSFSFQSWSGDSFFFQANYLSRGSIVTAVGHPKLVLYRISPSTPLETDNRAGDLSYKAETGGTIYLDVSSRHPSAKFTSSYQIVVSLLR